MLIFKLTPKNRLFSKFKMGQQKGIDLNGTCLTCFELKGSEFKGNSKGTIQRRADLFNRLIYQGENAMSWPVASAIFASLVTLVTPILLQAAPTTCDGVETLLTTSDITAGSPIKVEVTVRDDLKGEVKGVVQLIAQQGTSSILTSKYQTFSDAKTTVTLNTKSTTVESSYKGTFLGSVKDVPCDERVAGVLDLRTR